MLGTKKLFTLLPGAILLSSFLVQTASADKEGGLSLYSMTLDSPGTDNSGPVHVEIKRSDEGIEKFVVSAFGRNETAPLRLLQSIKEKRWLSGLQLSFSRGYRLTRGKTVYVSLTEGGSWGAVVVAVIGFSEDGKFKVFDNLSRQEVEKKFGRGANK